MSELNIRQRAFADEYIITGNVYGVVYQLTNKKNHKVYVGVTTRNAIDRFKEHCKADSYIGKAIRKHGENEFLVSIIDTASNKEELMDKEIYWIAQKESFGPLGYNLTNGGDGINNKIKVDRKLNQRQISFIERVNDYNSKKLDATNQKEMVKFVIYNSLLMYLSAEYESDLKHCVKLISKFNHFYLRMIDNMNLINLAKVYDLSDQKESSLGVFLSHEQ